MKRITSITIKHNPDEYPDFSHLGTFSDTKGKYAVKHDGGMNSYQYFNADNVENMKQAKENYSELMEYENGTKYYIGISAAAEVQTSQDGKHWLINHISSGVLWGLDSDCDNSDVEKDQLEDLYTTLKEYGFTETDFNEVAIITKI